METQKENILKEKSFLFAVHIVKLCKLLADEKKEFVVSRQILRSGTSVGANIREANSAESKPDFIHKLSIALKETDESLYWLELLKETDYITDHDFTLLYSEAEEIIKILKRSLLTAKSRK
jgi:four helix bundle protein